MTVDLMFGSLFFIVFFMLLGFFCFFFWGGGGGGAGVAHADFILNSSRVFAFSSLSIPKITVLYCIPKYQIEDQVNQTILQHIIESLVKEKLLVKQKLLKTTPFHPQWQNDLQMTMELSASLLVRL